MLKVVIGIIFVLLLLSLLATTIMELISGWFSLRGRNLEKALKNMLANTDIDDKLLEAFKENALYKQLSEKKGYRRGKPSYIDSDTFQSILFDIILKGEGVEKLESKIDEVQDPDLKQVMRQLLRDADYKLDNFKYEIKGWYNKVMDRASGWYTRFIKKILVVIGLIIAVVFNADTIAIYERLESDPETLQKVVGLAEDFIAKNDESTITQVDPEFKQSYANVKSLLANEIESIKSPLGLGWKNVNLLSTTPYDWVIKILGWLVTALAISLGAPFWFDLLRKIVNIRNSGDKPAA